MILVLEGPIERHLEVELFSFQCASSQVEVLGDDRGLIFDREVGVGNGRAPGHVKSCQLKFDVNWEYLGRGVGRRAVNGPTI